MRCNSKVLIALIFVVINYIIFTSTWFEIEQRQETSEDEKIFVVIAAYRDPELEFTIADMRKKARHPERLKFGLCIQDVIEQLDYYAAKYLDDTAVKFAIFETQDSKGTGWARMMAQQFYDNEKYILNLDAHFRFVQDWDEILLTQFKQTFKYSQKPVITYYPGMYEERDETLNVQNPNRVEFLEYHTLPRFYPMPYSRSLFTDPQPWTFMAGGFSFAHSNFIREVPADPDIYFSGEEIMWTVRAWTRGYDFFLPTMNVAYHQYITKKVDRVKHWDDHKDFGRSETASVLKIRDALLGQPNGWDLYSTYGFGTLRSIKEYENFAYLDFFSKTYGSNATQYIQQVPVIINRDYQVPKRSDIDVIKANEMWLLAAQLTGTEYSIIRDPSCVIRLVLIPNVFISKVSLRNPLDVKSCVKWK